MKRWISLTLCIILVFLALPTKVNAGCIYTIKVPMDATISYSGTKISENSFPAEFASGRIHDFARLATGTVAGYKYYTLYDFTGIDQLTVYNSKMVPLAPTTISVENGMIEYAGITSDYYLAYTEKIRGAAIAYHNRTGGYGTAGFYNYFLSGSDAAAKCELSDSGRYWGQFTTARIIENVEILEIVAYGENAFTTKVRIVADGAGYVEDYTINFLFQKVNNNFFVTYFTFMK